MLAELSRSVAASALGVGRFVPASFRHHPVGEAYDDEDDCCDRDVDGDSIRAHLADSFESFETVLAVQTACRVRWPCPSLRPQTTHRIRLRGS